MLLIISTTAFLFSILDLVDIIQEEGISICSNGFSYLDSSSFMAANFVDRKDQIERDFVSSC